MLPTDISGVAYTFETREPPPITSVTITPRCDKENFLHASRANADDSIIITVYQEGRGASSIFMDRIRLGVLIKALSALHDQLD